MQKRSIEGCSKVIRKYMHGHLNVPDSINENRDQMEYVYRTVRFFFFFGLKMRLLHSFRNKLKINVLILSLWSHLSIHLCISYFSISLYIWITNRLIWVYIKETWTPVNPKSHALVWKCTEPTYGTELDYLNWYGFKTGIWSLIVFKCHISVLV